MGITDTRHMGRGVTLAILAAALYALNAPLSKLLLTRIGPTMLAGLLYLGAGVGMGALTLTSRTLHARRTEAPLSRADLPYTVAMVLLDVAAPVLLMLGLSHTTASNASLLNNFEIVATSLLALLLFRERIGARLGCGIGLVCASCLLLSFEDVSSLQFSVGSLFILLACVCWGFENNCTRRLSDKSPAQIVVIKGLCSGGCSVVIALCLGEEAGSVWYVLAALGVGFVAYGLSILCYVYAQRFVGAARTSAYYAIAPFLGVLLSVLLLGEWPRPLYYVALLLMILGAYLCASDRPLLRRRRRTVACGEPPPDTP